jgi:hypothetical protein
VGRRNQGKITTVEARLLRICWLGEGMRFLADFLEPRLVQSHTTVIIPFDDRVIFVRPLDCAQFPSRLSEISQTLDPISGTQFLVGSKRVCKRRLHGTVCIRRCAGVRQRRLGSFTQFWCQAFR